MSIADRFIVGIKQVAKLGVKYFVSGQMGQQQEGLKEPGGMRCTIALLN
jgi:hypothetical protein